MINLYCSTLILLTNSKITASKRNFPIAVIHIEINHICTKLLLFLLPYWAYAHHQYVTVHHKWAVKLPSCHFYFFSHISREHVVRIKITHQWPSYGIHNRRYGSSMVVVDQNVKQRKMHIKFRSCIFFIWIWQASEKCSSFFIFLFIVWN